jgi:hypothetical protein
MAEKKRELHASLAKTEIQPFKLSTRKVWVLA